MTDPILAAAATTAVLAGLGSAIGSAVHYVVRRRRPTLSEAADALRFARLSNDREAEARAREAYHDALRREGVL